MKLPSLFFYPAKESFPFAGRFILIPVKKNTDEENKSTKYCGDNTYGNRKENPKSPLKKYHMESGKKKTAKPGQPTDKHPLEGRFRKEVANAEKKNNRDCHNERSSGRSKQGRIDIFFTKKTKAQGSYHS